MKNKVQFIIFLFFGFAFLVYLFPFIFVEAAKVESGVTINAPATTETEKICNDTIDNDNDGKIDTADEDCAAAPAGPTAGTCGLLQIVSGVPINYGQLTPGQLSTAKQVVIKNVALASPAKIMIKGGNWIGDAAPNPTISGPEVTRVWINPVIKNPLSLAGSEFGQYGLIESGQSLPVYFQFMTPVSGVSGSFHQEVTIDLIC